MAPHADLDFATPGPGIECQRRTHAREKRRRKRWHTSGERQEGATFEFLQSCRPDHLYARISDMHTTSQSSDEWARGRIAKLGFYFICHPFYAANDSDIQGRLVPQLCDPGKALTLGWFNCEC